MDAGNPISIAELLQTFQGDEDVAVSALYRLSDLFPEDMALFREGWNDVSDERRRIVIRHLADISEENFEVDFNDIFAFCLGDQAAEVRLAALDGLWDSERTALINPIVKLMLSDPEERVRTVAAATLGHYILLAEWNQIPSNRTDAAVEALLQVLDSSATPRPVWRSALESLSPSSHERVPSLVEEAYDSGDQDMQISAVYAMGRTADKRWLPIIIDEMASSTMEMRLEAARAAGHIGNTDAVSELADLVTDEDLEVRLAAIEALGQIGGRAASRILEEMDGDRDFDDVQFAVEDALEQVSLFDELDLSLLDWDNGPEDDRFPTA